MYCLLYGLKNAPYNTANQNLVITKTVSIVLKLEINLEIPILYF